MPSKASGPFRAFRFGALRVVVLAVFLAVAMAFSEAWITLCTGGLSDLVETSSTSVIRGTLIVGVALLVVGIADLCSLRWLEHRALKMSRREAKERERDELGAPEMRHYHQRLRRRSQRVDHRMEVRQAMMLVTGFGDWVILLHGGSPPTVGRRVRGELASVILARARVEGVLIGHDPALGYTLISVPVGKSIPRSAYGPVSRWSLRTRRVRAVA
jgi:type III secretory pathway component EscU